jgi:protein TonB
MIDPVSEELERRSHLDLPWRWAMLGAFGLHLAVAGTLVLAPSHRQRALMLPRVQVRLLAAPVAPAGAQRSASAPAQAPAEALVPAKPSKASSKPAAEPPPRHPLPGNKAVHEAPPETEQAPAQPPLPGAAGQVASSSAGIALGVASGGGEESFPFAYYLNRVLALIESNWFRPPAPTDTRCRIRCVIDRAGRLVEAGLEQESASAAFDRAALRAVYAAAPLPPLPQGFGGTTLTLHLEFGP